MNGGDRPRSRSGRSPDLHSIRLPFEELVNCSSSVESSRSLTIQLSGMMSVSVRRSVAFDISNVGASISTLDRGFDSATFNALAHAR